MKSMRADLRAVHAEVTESLVYETYQIVVTQEHTARRSRNQSRTTGILPVPEHGLEGRGTEFVRRTKILANSTEGTDKCSQRPRRMAFFSPCSPWDLRELCVNRT